MDTRHGVVHELTRLPEGGVFIAVPALSGCTSYGGTVEDALDHVPEAIDLCVGVPEKGWRYPPSST
jgi:predicted RNase H-like HicB family nuclease